MKQLFTKLSILVLLIQCASSLSAMNKSADKEAAADAGIQKAFQKKILERTDSTNFSKHVLDAFKQDPRHWFPIFSKIMAQLAVAEKPQLNTVAESLLNNIDRIAKHARSEFLESLHALNEYPFVRNMPADAKIRAFGIALICKQVDEVFTSEEEKQWVPIFSQILGKLAGQNDHAKLDAVGEKLSQKLKQFSKPTGTAFTNLMQELNEKHEILRNLPAASRLKDFNVALSAKFGFNDLLSSALGSRRSSMEGNGEAKPASPKNHQTRQTRSISETSVPVAALAKMVQKLDAPLVDSPPSHQVTVLTQPAALQSGQAATEEMANQQDGKKATPEELEKKSREEVEKKIKETNEIRARRAVERNKSRAETLRQLEASDKKGAHALEEQRAADPTVPSPPVTVVSTPLVDQTQKNQDVDQAKRDAKKELEAAVEQAKRDAKKDLEAAVEQAKQNAKKELDAALALVKEEKTKRIDAEKRADDYMHEILNLHFAYSN